jgi:hypothetical protein
MDFRLALVAFLVAIAIPALGQQRRIDGQPSAAPQATPGDVIRPPQVRRHRAPLSERCANFAAELRDARRAEREATTTTSSDQASLRRQRLLEQSQKAGC